MKREKFCPVFASLQQLAEKKGLSPENTVLNNPCCPLAQACLGFKTLNKGWGFNEAIANCRIRDLQPPFRRIYVGQKGPKLRNPLEAFYNRLEKTANILGINY
ncbi:MAG: hypothetical protein N2482_03625 [Patescibacteria group bacterium]|nr:hypothetical protein [Patescibacteria group bacterium]